MPLLSDLILQQGFDDTFDKLDQALFDELLRRADGNVRKLSKMLQMPHSTLRSRLEKIVAVRGLIY